MEGRSAGMQSIHPISCRITGTRKETCAAAIRKEGKTSRMEARQAQAPEKGYKPCGMKR